MSTASTKLLLPLLLATAPVISRRWWPTMRFRRLAALILLDVVVVEVVRPTTTFGRASRRRFRPVAASRRGTRRGGGRRRKHSDVVTAAGRRRRQRFTATHGTRRWRRVIGRGSSVSVVVRVEATTAQFKFLLLIGASGDWRRRRSARSTAVVAVAGCGQVQRLPLLLWSAAVVEIVVLGGLWRLRRPRTTLASAARVCGSRMRCIEEEARGDSRVGSVRHFLGRL